MKYMNAEKEYPRYVGDIRITNPKWVDSDPLPKGWVKVEDVAPPKYDKDVVIERADPIEVDGVWYEAWTERALTEQERIIREAPETVKAKLIALGLNEAEISALVQGLVR
jgi:hypothetical protein